MLVPELTLPDTEAAGEVLRHFGFAPAGGLWRLGSQAVRLVAGKTEGHGRVDHIALTVPDIDAALAGLTAKGVALDGAITPRGSELIPEFWENGLRFVYLSGPEGARIELCQKVGESAPVGHDHIGIPCGDLAAMAGFFAGLGATPIAAVDLARPEGTIPVRFLAFAGGVIELYQPVTQAPRPAPGMWSRLLVEGLGRSVQGPEDLTLAPL